VTGGSVPTARWARWFFGRRRGCGRWIIAERRAVDTDGDAVMLQAVEQGVDHRLFLEEVVPFRCVEIGGNDRRDPVVARVHQSEEGVDLFRLEG